MPIKRPHLVLPALLLTTPTLATNVSWSTPTTGRWLDAARWSPASPSTSNPATLSTPGTYTVTLDATTTAGPVTLNNPNATLLVDDAASPALTFTTANLLLSAGSLTINQLTSATATPLKLSTGSTLTNNARIDLTGTGSSVPNGPPTLAGTLVNTGTLEAHDPAPGNPDSTFRLTSPVTNTGTITTGPHSALSFTSTFNQNAGALNGNLRASSGSTFNYNAGSVSLLTLDPSTTLKIAPAAHAGTFLLSYATLASDIPAGDTLYALSSNWTAAAGISNFTNAGTLVVGRHPTQPNVSGSLSLAASFPTLTNNGTFELNTNTNFVSLNAAIANNGTLTVRAASSLTPTNPAKFSGNITNNGNLTLEPGAYFQNDTFQKTFTQNAGTLTTNNALLLSSTTFNFNGGAIAPGSAVQLINSNLHFGTPTPGSPPQGAVAISLQTATTIDGDLPAGVSVNVTPLSFSPVSPTIYFQPTTNAGTFAASYDARYGNGRHSIYLGPGNVPVANTGTITGFNFSSSSSPLPAGIYATAYGNLTNTGSFTSYSFILRALAAGTGIFNQNAGSLVNNTYFDVRYGTFNYNGGTITGLPISLTTATLNLAPGVGPASFTFDNSLGPGVNTLNSPIPAGITISLYPNATLKTPAPPVIAGSLQLQPKSTLLLDYSTPAPPLEQTRQLLLAHSITPLNALPNTSLAYLDLSLLPAADPRRTTATNGGADPTTLLLFLTPTGDANGDGTLNADDYVLLDRSLAQQLPNPHWTDGDFNYDGLLNDQDYLLIDTAYLSTHPADATTLLPQRESQFGPTYVSTLLASLPEPSTPLACGFAIASLLPRRHFRRNA